METEGDLYICKTNIEITPGCDGDAKSRELPAEEKDQNLFTEKVVDNGVLRKALLPDIFDVLKIELKRHDCPDFQVVIEDDVVDCYRLVLRCYTGFFTRSGVDCSNLVKPQLFRMIYAWMCDQKTFEEIANPSTIVDLIKASQKLHIEVLEDLCIEYLERDLFIEEMAFFIFAKASLYKLSYVKDMMYKRIKRSFLSIVSTREFLELDVGSLCFLLKSPYIEAESELEIFYSAIRWLSYKWLDRRKYVFSVMACILLSHLPAWKLIDLSRNSASPEVVKVLRQDALQMMLNNSIEDAVLREENKLKQGGRETPIKTAGKILRGRHSSRLVQDWNEDKIGETYEEFITRIENLKKKFVSNLNEKEHPPSSTEVNSSKQFITNNTAVAV